MDLKNFAQTIEAYEIESANEFRVKSRLMKAKEFRNVE